MPDVPSTVSSLHGVNVLLMGATGTGKTYAIRTLVKQGITPFCVFTEPGFEVLGDIPAEKLHWQYIPPSSQSFEAMIDVATKINTYSLENLSKMIDPNRAKEHHQFVDLLKAFHNFKCDRTGGTYGSVSTWNTDRALVVDSLSGMGIMAMGLQIGGRPVASPSDWQIGMSQVEKLVQKLCMDTRCHFVMIAHSEREIDEVAGGAKIMASTLGKKLAPKLPRFFSDVVMAERQGSKFTWSTAAMGADLKARNLPIKDGIEPDFGQIITKWKAQGGTIQPTAV